MATMNTNIKINIVEPGSSTPVDPTPIDPVDPSDTTNTTNTTTYTSSTDISVPDTGLFTHGIGGTEATIITISTIALLLTIIATIVTVLYKKHIRQGKVTKLVRTIEQTKTIIKSKKRISSALSAIALLASVGTLAILLANSNKTNTNAMEGGTELTVDVDSEELTIEVGDTPVFAYLPVELTVEEATTSGYILSAYAEDTNLVSTTDESNIIPMVAINEEDLSQYVSLTDNTWGLSLAQPQDQNSEVYTNLSIDQNNPTILKSIDDYSETEANDTTTIYYGFYITPDIPKGTYEGSEINYTALTNPPVATVTFDGNGLYFNSDTSQTTNIVKYIPGEIGETKYSHTSNLDDNGDRTDIYEYSLNMDETFTYDFEGTSYIYMKLIKAISDSCNPVDPEDYFSFWLGNHPDYTAKDNYNTSIRFFGNTDGKYLFNQYTDYGRQILTGSIDSSSVTFAYTTGGSREGYCGTPGYGYYAELVGYNKNELALGQYIIPTIAELEGYQLLGWSRTPDSSIAEYAPDADFSNPNILSLNENDTLTLYAIWTPAPFSINYDGNGATFGNMISTDNDNNTATLSHQNVILGDIIDLYAPNYKKNGYGFVGWSQDDKAWEHFTNEDQMDDPIIYGPNQSFVVDRNMALGTIESGGIILYAVWAPAEQDVSGNPVSFQNWQGCNELTATVYNGETDTFIVKKNTITALTDNRDGNVYTVAKLADGNCWMTENLRLDDTAIITTANTNKPYTTNNEVAIRNNDNKIATHLSPSSNSWCRSYQSTSCRNLSYLNNDNTNITGDDIIASYNGGEFQTGKDYQWYSYGNYYNWYSATAGNGVSNSTAFRQNGDICPTGWHVPYSGEDTNGGFYYLNQQMGGDNDSQGSNNWRSFPNNFIESGKFFGYTSAYSRGEVGFYWSPNRYVIGNGSSYHLYLSKNSVLPSTTSDVDSGFSIRCVTLSE